MARTSDQNRAIYQRRNEIAQENGYDSYYQMRKYRKQVRDELREDYDFRFGRYGRDIEALDQIAIIVRNVEVDGESGLSRDELYDTVKGALLDVGILDSELLDSNGYDIPWAIIRHFYPNRGARSMAA